MARFCFFPTGRRMKTIWAVLVLGVAAGCSGGPDAASSANSFPGKPGLQLYSLRGLAAEKGAPAVLDQTKAFGITTVELAGTYNLKPAEFLPLLAERGLKPVSGHFAWDRWKSDPDGVAAEAKSLGLEYA